MTDLSPAAQAVLTASLCVSSSGSAPLRHRQCLAAALRAAADQLLPETAEPNRSINTPPERDVVFIGAWHIWNNQRKLRREFLAIATELETIND
jgi:hypothetical protein